jgi:hypothetical protein
MNVLNLTQHNATPEQQAAGVVEMLDKNTVQKLLTFDEVPTREEVLARAKALAELAQSTGCKVAMIGGAMWLMAPLERALISRAIKPVYAFSKRVVEEVQRPDGSVEKKQIFRHAGFVEAA